MAQYRKKPVVIEAEQWQPGKEIDGVLTVSPKVLYSRDRNFCYLSVPNVAMPRYWMGVEKIPGPMTEDEQNQRPGDIFQAATLEITKPDGEVYRRKLLDFTFFDVKSGDIEEIDLADDLAQDYWRVMQWPEKILTIAAYVETLEGRMQVSPGDWIITGVKGEKYPCKDEIFRATYEPVEDNEAWVKLRDLPPGMVFCTQDGVLAVKSEYHNSFGGQCMCVLLESGEYAYFTDGNNTLVQAIEVCYPVAGVPDGVDSKQVVD